MNYIQLQMYGQLTSVIDENDATEDTDIIAKSIGTLTTSLYSNIKMNYTWAKLIDVLENELSNNSDLSLTPYLESEDVYAKHVAFYNAFPDTLKENEDAIA